MFMYMSFQQSLLSSPASNPCDSAPAELHHRSLSDLDGITGLIRL